MWWLLAAFIATLVCGWLLALLLGFRIEKLQEDDEEAEWRQKLENGWERPEGAPPAWKKPDE